MKVLLLSSLIVFILILGLFSDTINCALNFAVNLPPTTYTLPRFKLPPMKMSMYMNHQPESEQIQFPRVSIVNQDRSIIIRNNVSPINPNLINTYHLIRPSTIDPMLHRRKLYRMAGYRYNRKYFDKVAKSVSVPYLLVLPKFTNSTINEQKNKMIKVNCPNCFQNSQKISHQHHHIYHHARPKKISSYQYQGLIRKNHHENNSKIHLQLPRSSMFTSSTPLRTIKINHT